MLSPMMAETCEVVKDLIGLHAQLAYIISSPYALSHPRKRVSNSQLLDSRLRGNDKHSELRKVSSEVKAGEKLSQSDGTGGTPIRLTEIYRVR
jgi:hypothetical protein